MEPDSIKIGNLIHADRTIKVTATYRFENDKEMLEIFNFLESQEGRSNFSACLIRNIVTSYYYDNYFKLVEEKPLLGIGVDYTGSEEE